MPIRLVVCDVAGTTLRDDDAVGGCFRAALAAAGLAVEPAAANRVMGLPKREALRMLIEPSPQANELLPKLEAIHADFVARMIRHYETDPNLSEIPGTSAAFRALKRAGIAVAVDTGFSREILAPILRRVGWERAGLLAASIASDEAPRGRPHPDMIELLMKRLGVADPKEVAKVGDTPADLLQGTAAGCGWVVGVGSGTHTLAELEAFPHTALLASIAELPARLGLPAEGVGPP